MSVYYNEIDPYAAQWLRNLIAAGELPAGDVDERDIRDVTPTDLLGYRQCHFFAGIGGWPLALRLAGYEDLECWTGSCPCQPFSAAGARAGFADERHLWPAWHWLIEQCGPAIVLGEQVASGAAKLWIDLVSADLEGLGYAFGAGSVPACGVGGPHLRQRTWFVAARLGHTFGAGSQGRNERRHGADQCVAGAGSMVGGVADAESDRQRANEMAEKRGRRERAARPDGGAISGLVADAEIKGPDEQRGAAGSSAGTGGPCDPEQSAERSRASGENGNGGEWPGPVNGFWRDADWLRCRDEYWRPVEPASQRMANGLSFCLERLRTVDHPEKEIVNASDSIGLGSEILRALRGGDAPEKIWFSLGGCLGFPQATVLLAVMCEHEGELGSIFYGSPSGSSQTSEAEMRKMQRRAGSNARSSSGWRFSEQQFRKLRDALSKLSQDSASFRELVTALAEYTPGPLADGVANRVGKLRAYGNAIVPQAGAAFIEAAIEALADVGDGRHFRP